MDSYSVTISLNLNSTGTQQDWLQINSLRSRVPTIPAAPVLNNRQLLRHFGLPAEKWSPFKVSHASVTSGSYISRRLHHGKWMLRRGRCGRDDGIEFYQFVMRIVQ